MSAPRDPSPPASEPVMMDLKILATTDLHMYILDHDYLADRPSQRFGLSRAATVIATERATAANSLLLDNGDSLQGGPMGDFLADAGWRGRSGHPAIAAMNTLRYDAATLGNHDFSHGLRYLNNALRDADFPIVSTNLLSRRGLPVHACVMLQRMMRDRRGGAWPLRIGILGFLPPQTVDWEPELRQATRIGDILEHAQAGIAALRTGGADLVIALSHSGIGDLQPVPMMENAATALAALPGIDAVIAGHTHRVFPSDQHPAGPGIDPQRGTLAGKPCVMPGFWGSHLGVIELALQRSSAGKWSVANFRCRAEPVRALPPHQPVIRTAQPAHRATLQHFRRRIGRSDVALTSFFTMLGHDPGLRLVCMAQRWHARRLLAAGPWRDLPILSAAAPFRAGGRGGPDHYTDVPAGPLTLRSLADLYLFPNRLCAILVSGADVACWLERSASIFLRIAPGAQDQPLIDPEFPSYNFDLIDGVGWQLDLSQPSRYAADGRLLDPDARRVTNLRHRGRPVTPDQRFVLVTNSYRLSDSGVFSAIAARRRVVLQGGARTRDVLRQYVATQRMVAPPGPLGWNFLSMPGTTIRYATGPGAARHLELLGFRYDQIGQTPDGFLDLRLYL
ncbi:bifunctional 2',3'-cyclic-nucleotide 2'-phosphodiesterase/3'-nucleotidase [Paracoccus broussonetiae]|nr:bifunctional 2',3'-cyclic-nucleotide 2'-phosphodiesterase/3'-nucleotidase [Paracoccus sp. CPCC 101403]